MITGVMQTRYTFRLTFLPSGPARPSALAGINHAIKYRYYCTVPVLQYSLQYARDFPTPWSSA